MILHIHVVFNIIEDCQNRVSADADITKIYTASDVDP